MDLGVEGLNCAPPLCSPRRNACSERLMICRCKNDCMHTKVAQKQDDKRL